MSYNKLPNTVRFYLFRAGRPVPKWMQDVIPKDDGTATNLAAWEFLNKNGKITFSRTCMGMHVVGNPIILLPVCNNEKPADSEDISLLRISNFHNVIIGGVNGATGICFIMGSHQQCDGILQSYLGKESI